jgi:hypothetical protein
LEDRLGVFKAGEQGTAVDKVKLLIEDPLVFGIIYLETTVCGDPFYALAFGFK